MIESTHTIERTLTDGSKVYDVTIQDDQTGKFLARICMTSEKDAIALDRLINDTAIGIEGE